MRTDQPVLSELLTVQEELFGFIGRVLRQRHGDTLGGRLGGAFRAFGWQGLKRHGLHARDDAINTVAVLLPNVVVVLRGRGASKVRTHGPAVLNTIGGGLFQKRVRKSPKRRVSGRLRRQPNFYMRGPRREGFKRLQVRREKGQLRREVRTQNSEELGPISIKHEDSGLRHEELLVHTL